MSRLRRIGRTFTSCVGNSGTLDDDVGKKLNGRPLSFKDKDKAEDQQELIDLQEALSDEFFDRVQSNAVALEFLDHTKNQITGCVTVRNDAPDKQVIVRYTTSDWNSYEEIAAEWMETIESHGCDKFRFSISSLTTPCTVQLAVRYEVLEQQYWDNNNCNNYTVVYGY